MVIEKINIFLFIIVITVLGCIYENTGFEITVCYDGPKLNLRVTQFNKTVDIIEGTLVHFICNFCSSSTQVKDREPATSWSYKKRGGETNSTKSILTPTLNIYNYKSNDSGIYTCSTELNNNNYTFVYILDGILTADEKIKIGTLQKWQKFKQNYIDPINAKFNNSLEESYYNLRKTYTFSFQLIHAWEDWRACEPKSVHIHEGIRRKLGRCRLKPFQTQDNYCNTSSNISRIKSYYLLDNYSVSCRSITLKQHFPKISRIIRSIPDYEAREPCIIEKPVENTLTDEENDQNYKRLKQIVENGHTTLSCTDGDIGSKIEWFKDSNLLNSSFRNNMADKKGEPHITIDVYNTLYILHATKTDEGSYTCTVNGIKMREYGIKIVSMANILNQDFIRYSIYLGFVLSLTVTCYCAGLCVAWHRRTSFADPLNIQYNRKKKYIEPKLNGSDIPLLNK